MKTDRTKRPECRNCRATIEFRWGRWQHRHTQDIYCPKRFQPGNVASAKKVAIPPEGFEHVPR